MKKITVFGVPVFIALLAVWIYAGPYIALRGLKNSIAGKNPQAIYNYIDFPLFKESLKQQFLKEMNKENSNQFSDLSNAFVGGMVDMLVSPETIIKIFGSDEHGKDSSTTKSGSHGLAPDFSMPGKDIEMGYAGLNSFELTIPDPGSEWTFILHRKGFGWKIDGVRINQKAVHSNAPVARSESRSMDAFPAPGTPNGTSSATIVPETAPSDNAIQPSFDCGKASVPAEVAVCADGELAKLDLALAKAYLNAKERSLDVVSLQRDENNWRKNTRDACGTDAGCLKSAYEMRISQLQYR